MMCTVYRLFLCITVLSLCIPIIRPDLSRACLSRQTGVEIGRGAWRRNQVKSSHRWQAIHIFVE